MTSSGADLHRTPVEVQQMALAVGAVSALKHHPQPASGRQRHRRNVGLRRSREKHTWAGGTCSYFDLFVAARMAENRQNGELDAVPNRRWNIDGLPGVNCTF